MQAHFHQPSSNFLDTFGNNSACFGKENTIWDHIKFYNSNINNARNNDDQLEKFLN